MKHCDRGKGKCCWQSIYNSELCAYKEDMEEWMLCPEILNNWEEIIDKISDNKEKNNESSIYFR